MKKEFQIRDRFIFICDTNPKACQRLRPKKYLICKRWTELELESINGEILKFFAISANFACLVERPGPYIFSISKFEDFIEHGYVVQI